MLWVYSKNLAAALFNQFEINEIWRSLRLEKAWTPKIEKKPKQTLVVSLEGTLILSILLPAHFMPCSALIDVKIGIQIVEYQCVRVCVCACSCLRCTPARLLCVCSCVLNIFQHCVGLSPLTLPFACEPQCCRNPAPWWERTEAF